MPAVNGIAPSTSGLGDPGHGKQPCQHGAKMTLIKRLADGGGVWKVGRRAHAEPGHKAKWNTGRRERKRDGRDPFTVQVHIQQGGVEIYRPVDQTDGFSDRRGMARELTTEIKRKRGFSTLSLALDVAR